MGFVLRHVIDDLAVTLKQVYDDKIIQRSQIAYWILLIGNTLKAQHIQKRDSGAFLTTFIVPLVIDPSNGRKYFILPKTIYDFNSDKAIDCVASYPGADGSQFTKQTYGRTTKKTAERLTYSRYEKPSPTEPYFYRINQRIYTLGIEGVDIKELEVDLFTALDPLLTINIDEYIDFPDELMSTLRTQVIALARYSYIFPQERTNDGQDGNAEKQLNTPKIVSVNPDNT